MSQILETQELGIRFGGLIAVNSVSLKLKKSEIMCIIGPNGAGKSTLLNLISGIYRPTHGKVKLAGKDITNLSAHRVAQSGVARTFQSCRLFNDLTLLDNVIIGMHNQTHTGVFDALLRPKKARTELEHSAELAAEILKMISAELFKNRYNLAATLPQADRRRLEIARALASKPKLIMLDEPTSGMDDRDTDALINDIRHVMSEHTELSVLMIEHNMRLVATLPDHVAVMDYGKIIAQGDFAEIRTRPAVQEAYLGKKVGQHA